MSNVNTLLMRKGDTVADTLRDFGFATGEMPYLAKTEAKEVAVRDCPGEDGERVFFPDTLPLKAYDIEIEFKNFGELDTIYARYKKFRDYLTGRDGKGTELSIYSPYCGIGRQKVYMSGMGDPEFKKDEDGEYLKTDVKLHVADPVTDIILTTEQRDGVEDI